MMALVSRMFIDDETPGYPRFAQKFLYCPKGL